MFARASNMRDPRAVVLGFALVALSACAGGAPPPSLDECSRGWWLGTDAACGPSCPGPAECAADDCIIVGVLGLLPDQSSVRVSITKSETQRRFSAWGSPTMSTWSVQESPEGLALGSNEDALTVTCSTSVLTLAGVRNTRVDGALAEALGRATDTSNWQTVPY